MQEPSVRKSRLAIAGGFALVVAVGGAGFVVGRSTQSARQAAPAPVVTTPAPSLKAAPETVVETSRPLSRADLLGLAAAAADAQASGGTVPKAVRDAAGRPFDLVLPFGCAGPGDSLSGLPMGWRYDDGSQALKVTASPIAWRAEEWQASSTMGDALEGFWIARPWSTAESCPPQGRQAMPTGVDPITLPGQTVAIARPVTKDESGREMRAPRSYDIVRRVPRDRLDTSQGFRLRIIGRVEASPGGVAPITCVQPAGIEQRPICRINTRIDEVRIENAATSDVLGAWPTAAAD
ncbi:hypothetical protein ASE86_10410 [Sphingomonas sp. Leaf33]|uniref:hypothetical protein n=1 Tax=Sphingomonas sp. Leaf33 TaxID=1736215 RepID=UPI0006FAC7CC|nr:hypothetical protein [Sphingomonas sp. Leaf33]KQN26505.1 hypothetical protein ASE86_10410 [Sphingomonas sp. Leaf33]